MPQPVSVAPSPSMALRKRLPNREATRRLAVHAVGLVQGVDVPAGRWTLTFVYRPPGLTAGLVGSAVAVVAFAGAGVVWMLRRRRTSGVVRRRRRAA